jgi:hypothetical protein
MIMKRKVDASQTLDVGTSSTVRERIAPGPDGPGLGCGHAGSGSDRIGFLPTGQTKSHLHNATVCYRNLTNQFRRICSLYFIRPAENYFNAFHVCTVVYKTPWVTCVSYQGDGPVQGWRTFLRARVQTVDYFQINSFVCP